MTLYCPKCGDLNAPDAMECGCGFLFSRACGQCGTVFEVPAGGRPAIYCRTICKGRAREARLRSARLVAA